MSDDTRWWIESWIKSFMFDRELGGKRHAVELKIALRPLERGKGKNRPDIGVNIILVLQLGANNRLRKFKGRQYANNGSPGSHIAEASKLRLCKQSRKNWCCDKCQSTEQNVADRKPQPGFRNDSRTSGLFLFTHINTLFSQAVLDARTMRLFLRL